MQNVVGPILVATATKFGLGAEIYTPTGLFVCLSVCNHDNSRTVRDITTKLPGYHPTVETGKRDFENGSIAVHGW